MKKLMGLIIESNHFGVLKKILRQIIEELNGSWEFRTDLVEQSAANINNAHEEIGCFEYSDNYGESVFVWMAILENKLQVVNIVTAGVTSLSHDEYNRLLNLFYRQCIDPVIQNMEVKLTITASIDSVRKLAGTYTYEALLNWERNYKPGIGNTDSNFGRWADFVCIAFDEGSQLNSGLLKCWLLEERRWTDNEVTEQVVTNYGFCLALLEHYDANY